MDFNEKYPSLRRDREGTPEMPDRETQRLPAEEKERKSFADIFATILSWVLVPLMMPVYGIMLIFHLSVLSLTTPATKHIITLIVAGFDVVLPMLLVYLLKLFGLVSDVGLNERKERLIPYMITMVCMTGTAIFIYMKGAPLWVAMFFAGGALAALINTVINHWWKISAHAAGIAGIVAILIRIYISGLPTGNILPWLIAAIILSGLLGSCRVWLGRHTVWQVLAGYATGFLSVFLLTMI